MTIKADANNTGPDQEQSIDDLLGGAIRLIQPRNGYRVAMDTVLLAAAVPAKADQKILEGGVGSAGAALSLARRVKGAYVHGVDIQPEMLRLAEQNIAHNKLQDYVSVSRANITDLSDPGSKYDHVMLNPPYLEKGVGLNPKTDNKSLAHVNSSATLQDWLRFGVHNTKARGTLSVIFRADQLDKLLAGLAGKIGDIIILPLWPKEGKIAKRVIVQGLKSSKGTATLLPGICLHGSAGERYSSIAESVLRDGEGLDLRALAQKVTSG